MPKISQVSDEIPGMFENRVLSCRLEEMDNVGIVTICDDTGFWDLLGEQLFRPRLGSSISEPGFGAFTGQPVNEDNALYIYQ